MEKRQYAMDTHLLVRMPFGLFAGGRVLCSDGVVRQLKRISQTADTFFSMISSYVFFIVPKPLCFVVLENLLC